MRRNRIAFPGLVPTALPPRMPNEIVGKEEAYARAFGIDDFCASPWIGLHYRHEFLLHCNHELLEYQHPKD
ncbi:hypothetical protein BJY19_003404 [Arthrobacter cupressi]|nr:hypothetical protein [Arthrobacter cupressi]